MGMLLPKIFIKDYKNTQNPKVRKAYGILSGIVGILCNTLISAAKITAGILFSSIAIIADGLNNLSDAGSSVISIVGFKIADRPPDKEHPFGHARLEYVTGMIIAFLILFIGLQLTISSVQNIFEPPATDYSYVMLIILCAGIVIKLGMFFIYKGYANAIRSSALRASSMDSISDVAATSAVVISFIVSKTAGIQLDAYMGILVSLFIIFSGIKVLKDTLSPLLGEKPNNELVSHIYAKIHSYENVLGIHDLVVHNYGPSRNFASVHVEVDSKRDIMDSHELIDKIEKDFEDENIHLVIHLDPIVTDNEQINDLKKLTLRAVTEIDPDLRIHDFRAVLGKQRTNLIFDLVVPNKFKLSDAELLEAVERKIKAEDDTLFTVICLDKNYIGDASDC